MKFHTQYNTGPQKCKRYFRSCRSVRRRTKQEAKNVRISATGMEYRTPISPNALGSSITSAPTSSETVHGRANFSISLPSGAVPSAAFCFSFILFSSRHKKIAQVRLDLRKTATQQGNHSTDGEKNQRGICTSFFFFGLGNLRGESASDTIDKNRKRGFLHDRLRLF